MAHRQKSIHEKKIVAYVNDVLDGKIPVVSHAHPDDFANRSQEAKYIGRNIRYIKKDKTISLRISEEVLDRVKEKAQKEWIPYQTLIWSWIYKKVMD